MYLIIINHILEALIVWRYNRGIFGKRVAGYVELLVFTICFSIMYGAFQLHIVNLNTIVTYIVIVMIGILLYKMEIKMALLHAFILIIFMNVSEMMAESICCLFNNDYYGFMMSDVTLLTAILISKLLYFSFSQCIVFLTKKFISDNINAATIKPVVLMLIVSMGSILITDTFYLNQLVTQDISWIIMMNSAFVLIVNFLAFWLYGSQNRSAQKLMDLQLQLQEEKSTALYYQKVSEQRENQNILVHDIKQHLQTLAGLEEKGGSSEVKSYVDSLLDSPALAPSVTICNYPVLNVMLSEYRQVCKEKNIDFMVNVQKATLDFMAIDDMTALFGNLLKNAVAAAENREKAYIQLNVTNQQISDGVIVSMENTSKPPVFDKHGKLVSQKKDKMRHGIGMKSVEKIVKKYEGDMKYYYEAEEKAFHMIIFLKNHVPESCIR